MLHGSLFEIMLGLTVISFPSQVAVEFVYYHASATLVSEPALILVSLSSDIAVAVTFAKVEISDSRHHIPSQITIEHFS